MNNINNTNITRYIEIFMSKHCDEHDIYKGTNTSNTLNGHFYINDIIDILQNNSDESNNLINYFSNNFNYEDIRSKVNRLLTKIFNYNNNIREDLNTQIQLFNENNVDEMTDTQRENVINSCRNMFNLIGRNIKYKTLNTRRITESKKSAVFDIIKSCKRKWVLNLVNDRDYRVWLNPLIEEFINENNI